MTRVTQNHEVKNVHIYDNECDKFTDSKCCNGNKLNAELK